MLCPNCGQVIPEDATRCSCCQDPLRREPAASAADPSPVAASPSQGTSGTHRIPLAVMAILCALGLGLFFALPFSPGPEEPAAVSQSDTPWFVNEGGTLYFLEHLYTGPEELTVPETVDGVPVTAIGDCCFLDCSGLTTVILPEGIISIGEEAFSGCTSIRGIFIPEGVTHIGKHAFLRCVSLEAISIPSTVETIGKDAFSGCGALAHILYNDTVLCWEALYAGDIGAKTRVYCTDGTFPR